MMTLQGRNMQLCKGRLILNVSYVNGVNNFIACIKNISYSCR